MGKPVSESEYKNLAVEVDQKGIPLDLTETDGNLIPIVSESFAECLYEYIDKVQLLPITIPERSDNYFILVIKNAFDCVDENIFDFEKFGEGNEIRPDLAGEYQSIRIIKIDSSRVNKHIFRISKYYVSMIISEDLKRNLEKANLRGIKFKLVS